MALGILEPKQEHVAGTVHVYKQAQENAAQLNSKKTITDKKGKVILLVPQPSDDPNDPLVSPAQRSDASTY